MYEQLIDTSAPCNRNLDESLVLLAEMQLALVGGGIGTVTIG
jgi:hypothetical protein